MNSTSSTERVSREDFLEAAAVLMQGLAQLMEDVRDEPKDDELVTAKEAAKLLGLKWAEQVYPMCQSGKLKHKRFGVRGYRIYKSSIDALTVSSDNGE